MKRKGAITFKGAPLTLEGNEIKVGDEAPDCQVTLLDMSPINLLSLKKKILVVTSVPSLDTPVCDRETRRFNKEALSLDEDIKIATVSVDLPFAQNRWCGAANIENIKVVSDYKNREFGQKYGVLIEELKLLARAIFIIDKNNIVKYVQVVKEMTNEPDYEDVLKAVKKLT